MGRYTEEIGRVPALASRAEKDESRDDGRCQAGSDGKKIQPSECEGVTLPCQVLRLPLEVKSYY